MVVVDGNISGRVRGCLANGPVSLSVVTEGAGVYTIHLNDGRKYVGSSTGSMRGRVNKSMRSKHAVRKAGYAKDDVVNVTWIDLPSGMGSESVRRVEQTVMEGLKDQGVSLVNRRDPGIRIPFGGYFNRS